jgi:beta-N-acetylhexosaminidase
MSFAINDLSQLLCIGIPADGDLAAVHELQPGGVVLMGRNAGNPHHIRRLTHQIGEACATPPFIAVDQEGGRVQRFTEGFTAIPSMRELAARGAQAVAQMAMTVAAELRAVGVSLNFAPVCDVPRHPEDTVIGDRAFGTDPICTALLAAEYIRGAGTTILACGKHFPGHGAFGIDSHQDLPRFDGDLEELSATHLVPFRAAMAAGVGAVMVGHLAVPALDASGAPATLSAPIVNGLLRETMGFNGLVVTDDLEMGALRDYDEGSVAVSAVDAGCDLLLYCHNAAKARSALSALARALEDGILPVERVERSLMRLTWAKRKYGVTRAE